MTFKSDLWLLLWIGLVALVAYTAKLKRKETVLGQETERYSLLFASIVFLPVFLFVSVGEIRSDVTAYYEGYEKLTDSISSVLSNLWSYKGPGFVLLEVFFKFLFGNNFAFFRIFIGLLQSIPIVVVLRKYSEDYVFSVFLFITMGYCNHWMMNGVRQFIAVCIIYIMIPLVIKHKYVPIIILFAVAISIHVSAVMMIPIVFVVKFKPWGKGIICSLFVFAIALYIFVNSTDIISEEILRVDDGSHPLRIFISAIPPVIAFIGRKRIAEANNPLINICVNLSAFSPIIYLVATFTNGIGTGRLPVYTGIFNLILLPYLCNCTFNEKNSKLLKISLVLFYIVYFFLVLYFYV